MKRINNMMGGWLQKIRAASLIAATVALFGAGEARAQHPVISTPAGSTFTDNGVVWRVLHDNGNGYKLIMTEAVYANSSWNRDSVSGTVNWQPYESGLLPGTVVAEMNSFYNGQVSQALKDLACFPALPLAIEPSAAGHVNLDLNAGISAPGAKATGFQGIVFPPSASEINRFVSGTGTGNNALRIGLDSGGTPRFYWVRTPPSGMPSTQNNLVITSTGGYTDGITGSARIRPTMWVRTTPPATYTVAITPAGPPTAPSGLTANATEDVTYTVNFWGPPTFPTYAFPLAITSVTVGGSAISTSLYTYNASTGVLVIQGSAIKGNIVINVTPGTVGPSTYAVHFAGNNNTGGTMTTPLTFTCGVATNLPNNGFTRAYHTFQGWSTNATSTVHFNNGATISTDLAAAGGSVTMTAVWGQHPAITTPPGSTFTDNGPLGNVVWRVIHNNGNGHKLLLKETVVGSATWNPGANWHPYESGLNNGTIVASMDNYYRDYVSQGLKDLACFPALPLAIEVHPSPIPMNYFAFLNDNAGISAPGAKATGFQGVIFPPSVSEANRFVSSIPANRIGRNDGGTAERWWIRTSPGTLPAQSNVQVDTAGGYLVGATGTGGLRPVMWVQTADPLPTYTVHFAGNNNTGGSMTTPLTFTCGVTTNLPNVGFTRTGHTFQGWSTNATTTVHFNNQATISADLAAAGGSVTMTAVWAQNTSTVQHVSKRAITFAGTLPAGQTLPANFTQDVTWSATSNHVTGAVSAWTKTPSTATYPLYTPPAAPTGYRIVSGSAPLITPPTSSPTRPNDETTVTFTYGPVTYTVAYTGNSAPLDTQSCTYGANYTYNAFNGSVPMGHSFDAWTNSAGLAFAAGTGFSDLATTQGATVTLYPKFRAHTYTVVYTGNSAPLASQSCTYGAGYTFNAFNGTAPTGYSFDGWTNTSGVAFAAGVGFSNLTVMDTATVTLYPRWKAIVGVTVPGPDGIMPSDDDVTVDGATIEDVNPGTGIVTVPEGGSTISTNGVPIVIPGVTDPVDNKFPEDTLVLPDGTIIVPGTPGSGTPKDNGDGTVDVGPGDIIILYPYDDPFVVPAPGGTFDPEIPGIVTNDDPKTVILVPGGGGIIVGDPSGITVPGPDGLLDTDDDVTVDGATVADVNPGTGIVTVPEGGSTISTNGVPIIIPGVTDPVDDTFPEDTLVLPDGTIIVPADPKNPGTPKINGDGTVEVGPGDIIILYPYDKPFVVPEPGGTFDPKLPGVTLDDGEPPTVILLPRVETVVWVNVTGISVDAATGNVMLTWNPASLVPARLKDVTTYTVYVSSDLVNWVPYAEGVAGVQITRATGSALVHKTAAGLLDRAFFKVKAEGVE